MAEKTTGQKEREIPCITTFKARYGTFAIENPRVLYLNVKAKVKPSQKKANYANDVKKAKKAFDDYVEGFFKDNRKYSDRFIYTCDVSENNIMFGRTSNLKYEILVKPIELKSFDDYSDDMRELSETLSSKLWQIMQDNHFDVC